MSNGLGWLLLVVALFAAVYSGVTAYTQRADLEQAQKAIDERDTRIADLNGRISDQANTIAALDQQLHTTTIARDTLRNTLTTVTGGVGDEAEVWLRSVHNGEDV